MHANRIVMKLRLLLPRLLVIVAGLAAALVLAGCASTGGESSTGSAAQPISKFKLADGDKPLFTFEARRSGVSAGARMSGVFMKDEDIQMEDIRSMVLDLTDFMAIIAKKEPLRQ